MNATLEITRSVHIPIRRLRFEYARSGGPGGQHVNKVATKVTLFYRINDLADVDKEERQRIIARLGRRCTADGVLRISVQESTSQWRNREIAIRKFVEILRSALRRDRPRIPTRPSGASRVRKASSKTAHSRKKADRRYQGGDE